MSKHKLRPSDDPALDARVRSLLDAAAAPAETAGPLPGEEEALAEFRASPQCAKRRSMFLRLVSARAAVAAAISTGVLLTGGLGAAAAGVLPGTAQEAVSTWLETVGISVPAGERADEDGDRRGGFEQTQDEETDETTDRRGGFEQTPGKETDETTDRRGGFEQTPDKETDDPRGHSEPPSREQADLPRAADHGKQASETAKNSTAKDADKRKEISETAADRRAGDRGSSQTPRGGKPDGKGEDEPPLPAPNGSGG
jgi:hypothetical protein